MSEEINKRIVIRCADIYLRFPEIMEEEFDDLLEFLEDEHIVVEGATDIFIDLKKENKQLKADLELYENGVYFSSEVDKLQNRIDKAITLLQLIQMNGEIDWGDINTLVNILRGEE